MNQRPLTYILLLSLCAIVSACEQVAVVPAEGDFSIEMPEPNEPVSESFEFFVLVDENGDYSVDQTSIKFFELKQMIERSVAKHKQITLVIQGDASPTSNSVMQLMGLSEKPGITKIRFDR